MSFLTSLLGFAIMLGVLVFVHEWGHFITARLLGIKVLRFSIGFGPVVWRRQWGETEWALSALPLGGYVKMLDEREGPVPVREQHRAFNRQPPWKRMLVVAAGPMINLLFAWLVFAFVYWAGFDTLRPVVQKQDEQSLRIITRVSDTPVWSWGDVSREVMDEKLSDRTQVIFAGEVWPVQEPLDWALPLIDLDLDEADPLPSWLQRHGFQPAMPPLLPRIGVVKSGTPAARTGLQPGDLVVAVNGEPVDSWQTLVQMISRHPGEQVVLTVRRNGIEQAVPVRLDARTVKGVRKGFLGVGPDMTQGVPPAFVAHVSLPAGQALVAGFERGWQLLEMTVEMIGRMLTGQAGLQNLSGPVSIAQFSGQALQQGWVNFLLLMGLLSLSLGVLNLLPVPILDGGHLLFDLIEWVRGRPLPESVLLAGQKVGMVLILMLTLLALTNDMVRLFNE